MPSVNRLHSAHCTLLENTSIITFEQFIKLIPNESKALNFGGFNAKSKVFFAITAAAINIIGFRQSVNGNAKNADSGPVFAADP